MMATIFREEFGEMLITNPVSTISNENMSDDNNLPSPEQLREKIILKVC